MAKRFTETEKWRDDWYLSVDNDTRIVYQWLIDNCNIAGLAKKEFKMLNYCCHTNLDEKQLIEKLKGKIFDCGDFFFIPTFLKHQYPNGLDSNHPAVRSARSILESFSMFEIVKSTLTNPSATLNQRWPRVKEKDKEKDCPLSSSSSFGKIENLFFGDVPEDLIEMSSRLYITEKADEWHNYVQNEIEKIGYKTQREVLCKYDEKEGRIDLVASKDGKEIAIELDYRTPRTKSIKKVRCYPAGMILLRDPKTVRLNETETDFEAGPAFGPEDLMALWNARAHPNLPRVQILNKTRETHIRARLEDDPDQSFWDGVIEKINKSAFLTGIETRWKCDFDWILKSPNLTKIIEGNYDDNKANGNAGTRKGWNNQTHKNN